MATTATSLDRLNSSNSNDGEVDAGQSQQQTASISSTSSSSTLKKLGESTASASTNGTPGDDDEPDELTILNLPENVIETIFSYLNLSDLKSTQLTCRDFNRVTSDENGEVWASLCLRTVHRDVINSQILRSTPTYKAKLRAFQHAWNPHDCSRNVFVKTNGFTLHRNPVAQSTDGIRGKIGFSRGRHAWEVVWEGPLGTVAVIGIAKQGAPMRSQGYIALLGQDEQSWGWNLVDNSLLHNGDTLGNYPLINNAPRYQVGETIRVILDCEDGTLSFEKDFEFLGVAFRGLPADEPLYPSVSAVYGNTEVSMVYLGPPLDG